SVTRSELDFFRHHAAAVGRVSPITPPGVRTNGDHQPIRVTSPRGDFMFAQQPTISANHPFAARFGHQTYLVSKKLWQFFGAQTVATFNQRFPLLATKPTLDFSLDPQRLFDRRLGIAAGILLCAIEGKQDSN